MRLRHYWPFIFISLAGCYSLDDVRQRPVAWRTTYSGTSMEAMTACLAPFYVDEYSVAAVPNPKAHRSTITLGMPTGAAALAEFEVIETVPGSVDVTWRHMGSSPERLGSVGRQARERADRCGRAA